MNKTFETLIEEATESKAKYYPQSSIETTIRAGAKLPNELLIMALEALDYIAHSPTRDCKEPFAAEVLKKIISKLEGASK